MYGYELINCNKKSSVCKIYILVISKVYVFKSFYLA